MSIGRKECDIGRVVTAECLSLSTRAAFIDENVKTSETPPSHRPIHIVTLTDDQARLFREPNFAVATTPMADGTPQTSLVWVDEKVASRCLTQR